MNSEAWNAHNQILEAISYQPYRLSAQLPVISSAISAQLFKFLFSFSAER
jgi:hypothetical protein